jgi:uncharacterized membrane protein
MFLPYGILTFAYTKNSHPVHPATVHIPLAFLTVANILNLVYGISLFLPSLSPLRNDKENVATLAILGYFTNVVGIIGSIPAIITGFAELYAMISTRGLYVQDEASGKNILDPIVKITLTHVSISGVVFVDRRKLPLTVLGPAERHRCCGRNL